jgi:superfamily II DNA helicase RecQ
MVAIDEAHLCKQWGLSNTEKAAFRPDYSRISSLRTILPQDVPFFACSATLAAETLEQLEKLAGFGRGRTLLRTSIDRPEISYVVQRIPDRTQKTYTSLYFLLDEAVDEAGKASPGRIPKTLVFLDSREQIIAAVAIFRLWLQAKDPEGYPAGICNQTIVVYFRDISKRDRKRVYSDFSRVDSPPEVISKTRILFCTEIIAQGANCPDVRRVIQYGLPGCVQSLDLLYQGFGCNVVLKGPPISLTHVSVDIIHLSPIRHPGLIWLSLMPGLASLKVGFLHHTDSFGEAS